MSDTVEWVPIGEFRVSRDPRVQLVTVTGPCVALALSDPEARAAGLLHVVLPGRRRQRRPGDLHAFYADTGVPLLVDAMVNDGARLDRLQATVVGGAAGSTVGNFLDLGRLNVEAVTARLQELGIPAVAKEVLGQMGRRISLDVSTGSVHVDAFELPAVPGIILNQEELPPNRLARLANDISRLRPDPALTGLVLEELHRAHPNWWAIRKCMGQDPLLAAHFFRLANSPQYGSPQEISSLEEALNLLGDRQLRRLWVMAATCRHSDSSLEDWGLDHFRWSRHCLASAVISRYLAAAQPAGNREEAFTAGLLHGLGRVGLANLTVPGSGPDLPVASSVSCGYLGGLILSAWNLPPRLVQAVAAHEAPGSSGNGGDLAVFLHAACGLSNVLGFTAPGETGPRPLSPEVADQVGLIQQLTKNLPGILQELRSWGLLDSTRPEGCSGPGETEAW
jgi:chemotaxis protein CheD